MSPWLLYIEKMLTLTQITTTRVVYGVTLVLYKEKVLTFSLICTTRVVYGVTLVVVFREDVNPFTDNYD